MREAAHQCPRWHVMQDSGECMLCTAFKGAGTVVTTPPTNMAAPAIWSVPAVCKRGRRTEKVPTAEAVTLKKRK